MARPCCALLLVLASGAFGAWEPEIEAKGRSWNALIEQELDRSMALYERPASLDAAEALLLEILGDPYRLVLVVGNRLVVDRRLLLQKKGMHHIEFVKSVMERAPLDNFAYQWEWNADGFNSEDQLVREGCPTPANMKLNRVKPGAGQESDMPNFKGSYLGRFPLVSADSWTSDHLSERSRRVDVFSVTRARGTLTFKRR